MPVRKRKAVSPPSHAFVACWARWFSCRTWSHRMMSRRLVFLTSIVATAASFFTLGMLHARHVDELSARALYGQQFDAFRAEVRSELGKNRRADGAIPAGTSGRPAARAPKEESADLTPSTAARAKMIAEIKQELQNEM